MSTEIISAIEERRTTVLFDPSHSLSDEQIGELIRLATKAPTSFNLQNWRFIAVRTPDAKARLRKVAWDQAKITEAAVTFIVCGQDSLLRTAATPAQRGDPDRDVRRRHAHLRGPCHGAWRRADDRLRRRGCRTGLRSGG